MKYSFGNSSARNLVSTHFKLNQLARKVLNYGVMDFSVIEGHRSIERQNLLYRTGDSQIDGITRKGKHNYLPSLAIDILPFPAQVNGVDSWEDKQRFHVLAGLFYAAAKELGIGIRWGGDWDGDGNNADSNFNDLAHFELAVYD